ncbi:C5a anaphylatoxin chemotactic receptor 1-like [Sebastes umbrosus]|uniref:C5a anaphylatoxin chemotactic receptor 1-like n=1 Tax=Sebastes umbrosus TaxID=72105 RepID=UPI00189F8F05|nr:C5a anaphylatoxin chemotactic receptor 1-like [Sebastes umbrosus]
MTVDDSFNASCSLFFNSSINNRSSSGTPLTSSLHPWYIIAGVITAVSCLLGIPANIAVIVKLSRHLHGSSISQRLFFNLAVSDLLCLLCLPVGVVIFFYSPHLTHGVCQLLFYFFFFCITSGLNILVLISIQRYYQVLHPNKWARLGRIWQRFLLFTVWMLGALVALPVVFLLEEKAEDEWTYGHSCRNQRITPVLEAFYILFIVSSHLVVLSFYLLLVRGVKRTQMPNKKQPRVTELFIRILAVSLVVGFFPLVLRMLYVAALFTASNKLLQVSKMLTFVECFYFFNHCLNPFLYFFASRHHRGESNTKRKCLLMPLNDNFE